jgi:tripartite ATP-independent transporter DctM subunit
MGRIAVPEMLRVGYDKSLATGTVACAGTLGSLIPPSVLMIIYGIFTGQSIGQLFLAGFIPGILTATVYAAMIVIRCRFNPKLAPTIDEETSLREKFVVLWRIWPLPLLILGVIGTIYGGVATPTEAAALGVIIATVIGIARGQMSWTVLRDSILESLESTAAIFFVAVGAVMLTRFMVFSGVPDMLADLVRDYSVNLLTLLLIISALQPFKVDLIWFGILLVKFVEIGLMTPPVGMNVYAMKTIVGDSVPLETIFRGVTWFLVCEAFVIVLLIMFPAIALWLPGLSWTPKLF